MSFVIHNRAEGLGLEIGEGGSPIEALNISFDSFKSDALQLSDAFIEIRTDESLAIVDLAPTIPNLSGSGQHTVRIMYKRAIWTSFLTTRK
ncbi:MAG: hypothetical protein CMJ64_24835 [Planctomycetaceae bacterium]|jgi:hypothetical protein|nr:hypothetical protein [Planctomycetaceae bacterium]